MPDNKAFFASVKVFDYLKTSFAEDFMKLSNQRVEKGTIFLTRNDFARLLSRLAFTQLLASLPLAVEGRTYTDLNQLDGHQLRQRPELRIR